MAVSYVLRIHKREKTNQGAPELLAVHDDIHETVLEEELGTLEPGREVLPDGLLDHAWSGEADQCIRLRAAVTSRSSVSPPRECPC